ncbi:EF-hand domain-containing protein [Rubellimicrobium sp. CFH 75288]|uniref:EF-hand domain-containing protein n=1 Tax=Rubellimicrobium sp. CFH 75288 TaxID=2697034 RepID=UPI001411F2EA|nr:EF-hand domain-containing protein [Rubellimicrobium sp. CFH 75288]NAZ37203.1 hypothetical protein [Rubellimicrobium sp. CFH 75288]
MPYRPVLAAMVAGLLGTAALAQAIGEAPAAPQADPSADVVPAQARPSEDAPDGARPTERPRGPERAARGPRADRPAGGPAARHRAGGVPNMAPLMLEIYDLDGDGRITREEIEARKAERFAEADADGDGGLSPEELVALEDIIRDEIRRARAAATIERFDDNGDGLLQFEEIEERTPRLAPIFDRLDRDGDGGISQDELDAAGDGRGEPSRRGGPRGRDRG